MLRVWGGGGHLRPGHLVVVHHLCRQQGSPHLPWADHVRLARVGVKETLVPDPETIQKEISKVLPSVLG